MTTIAVLQARMTSSRFPGKVFGPLAGEPMVLRQRERISRARTLGEVVVATSTGASDDPTVAAVAEATQTRADALQAGRLLDHVECEPIRPLLRVRP